MIRLLFPMLVLCEWAMLYYGVWLAIPGAWNLYVGWTVLLFIVTLLLLLIICADSENKIKVPKTRDRISRVNSRLRMVVSIGLLVWFGHFVVVTMVIINWVLAQIMTALLEQHAKDNKATP